MFALLAPDLVYEEHEGVFQLGESPARQARGLVGEGEVCFESDHADFQLAHLALEGEQAGALLGDRGAARRDELPADDELARGGHARLAGAERQDHRLLQIPRDARARLARERAAQDLADLARRAEQVGDAQARVSVACPEVSGERRGGALVCGGGVFFGAG